jgi:hypothetical protein
MRGTFAFKGMYSMTTILDASDSKTLVVSLDSQKATYAKVCVDCGSTFQAQRSTAKYCQTKCRVAAAKSSPAHVRYKVKQKRRRYLRHIEYTNDKMSQMYLHNNLGSFCGSVIKNVQPLKERPLVGQKETLASILVKIRGDADNEFWVRQKQSRMKSHEVQQTYQRQESRI